MAQVVLKDINKFYDDVHAVKDVNLQIRDKEFVVFVGPSGCGKTTTLRMIAGLEAISSGDISIDGTVVNDLAPMDRDIAMVFQNYALYPHMSVYDNMAFGLKMRKFEQGRDRQAREGGGRHPRHRRAPASASRASSPAASASAWRSAAPSCATRSVFLFDEPLSNLDAKLRVQMRVELKKLHQRLGTTAVYVTHDQVEAMTLGDRVVVMKDGLVQQVGEPLELYNQPANKFVAGFIGSPAMNFATVTMTDGNGRLTAKNSGIEIEVPARPCRAPARPRRPAADARHPARRTCTSATAADPAGLTFTSKVEVVEQLGSEILLDVRVGDGTMVAAVEPDHPRQGAGAAAPRHQPGAAALLRRQDRGGDLRCDGVRIALGVRPLAS